MNKELPTYLYQEHVDCYHMNFTATWRGHSFQHMQKTSFNKWLGIYLMQTPER